MRRRRGSSVAEALVATALAGLALAALASAARLATVSLRLARDVGIALALAGEQLEALRAGPRAPGTDVTAGPDGTRFTRVWSVRGGRGRPAALAVEVGWGSRAVRLETEAIP